jgi:hypothetical protein
MTYLPDIVTNIIGNLNIEVQRAIRQAFRIRQLHLVNRSIRAEADTSADHVAVRCIEVD